MKNISIRKRVLPLLLAVLLLTLAACRTDDPDISANGSQSESRSDTEPENSDKVTPDEVSETNPASDFRYEFTEDQQYVLITQYIGKSKNVVIPSQIEGHTVTNLKGTNSDTLTQGVFQDTDIETVVIPETVKVIGLQAFKNCTALSSVTIRPNSELQMISALAFENCSALKTIDLENAEKLKTIETKAFSNCKSIEKVQLPSNLETIGVEAFSNCSALRSVNIPTKLNLINLEKPSFYDVPALEEIIFDDGWQKIQGYGFFSITSTVNITVPESVTGIDADTFFSHGRMNFYFAGDCPQLIESDGFSGEVTIYYHPDTNGWDTTPLKDTHTLMPY